MFTTHCIKCKTEYQSPDPDPYYCPICFVEIAKIAQKIDEDRAKEPPAPKVLTDYQKYMQAKKINGFVRASDLF